MSLLFIFLFVRCVDGPVLIMMTISVKRARLFRHTIMCVSNHNKPSTQHRKNNNKDQGQRTSRCAFIIQVNVLLLLFINVGNDIKFIK